MIWRLFQIIFFIIIAERRVLIGNQNQQGIRAYRETLFFGLSVRQFVCSVLAVGVAVALYFSLSRVLDRETVSWVCIVGAAPVAAAGFFQYNGLTLERFLWVWLRSEVIMAGKRVWKAENYYEEALKREVKKH